MFWPWNRAPVSQNGFMSKVSTNQLGMKVLYKGSQVDVDIIAVHGLGAIPDITWREKTSQVNWLQDADMLPRTIPNSRIMRFGYDSLWFCRDPVRTRAETISNSFLASLQEHREDCPDRPVIFIGHCFGGLVIQKALTLDCLKNASKQGSTILSNTTGIVFLGTPHSGTVTPIHERMTNSNIISLILATSDLRLEGEVLKNLESSHNTLSDISKEFLIVCLGYNVAVVNFFEQRPSNVGKLFGRHGLQEFVVGEASATLGHYPSYGLPLDHYSLNKFASQDDGNFKLVQGQIKRIYMTNIVETPHPTNPPLYYQTSQSVQQWEGPHSPGRYNTYSDGEVNGALATSRMRTAWIDGNLQKFVELYPLAYNCDVSGLKSINSQTSTAITFVNKTATDVNVDWINYQGERQRFKTLKPAEVFTTMTFVTHPWEVIVGARTTRFLPTAAAKYIAFIGSTDNPTLDPLPMHESEHLRSMFPNGADTAINFINNSSSNANIFWIDFEGKPLLYKTLKPKEGYHQTTFLNHFWEVVTAQNTTRYMPTDSEADVRIE